MRLRAMVLTLCACVFLFGCHRRPLFDPEDSAILKVRLLTDGIHNVTCDIYNPNVEVPPISSEMLRVLIYEAGGTPILSQGFLSNKRIDEGGYELFSGALALSAGEYKLLSYNFDLETIKVRYEDSYNTIEASTSEVPQYYYNRFGSRAGELGRICYAPDHLMVARAPELSIRPHFGTQYIELDARTVVDTYYIQIRITGADNMAKNASCQAVITGLSPSNQFGPDNRRYDTPASLYFEMLRNTDPNTPAGENEDVLCAVFNTFGKIPDEHSELHITLSILTRDGQTHQKVIDMTPIFATDDARQRHWLLIDEVWDIPAPIGTGGGGGFTPDVEDWDDVEETIPIGPRH